jgi:hypothetical protein
VLLLLIVFLDHEKKGRRPMIRFLWFVLLIAAAFAQSNSGPSTVADVPGPSGPFAVGHIS